MSAEALNTYLDAMGILGCNVNPYLPSLDDIGCTWADAVELIDRKALFYCKCYRRRTVYLSQEVYGLLKACLPRRPMPEAAALLYALLEQAPGLESGALRERSLLGQTDFVKALDFLLSERYATALFNGTWLNPNWSTFRYGTAEAWEQEGGVPPVEVPDPVGRLRTILARSLPQEEITQFLRGVH